VSDFTVGRATVDDAAGIAGVHVQVWRDTYADMVEPGELDELSLERRTERWRTNLEAEAEAWVAVTGDGIVGFAGATSHDEQAVRPRELQCIYVLVGHHGTGIAQALFDAAIGDVPAFLFVAQGNPRATRFYERNGFAFDGASESYPLVRTPITSLRMVR
jgi:GNAT superfamily N-acetyltransferase